MKYQMKYESQLIPLEDIADDPRFVRIEDPRTSKVTYEWNIGSHTHVFDLIKNADGDFIEYAGPKMNLATRVETE